MERSPTRCEARFFPGFRNAKKVVNIAFYRTGSTSRPLEVADTVGGTATPGIDDTGLATALAVRTI